MTDGVDISSTPTLSAVIPSPLGTLGIHVYNDQLSKIEYLSSSPLKSSSNHFTQQVIQSLTAYFTQSDFQFHLSLDLIGTNFQKKVWHALMQIPKGQTKTYAELAGELKTGARAIGNACRANPIPIIMPCHRVIAKNHIGGYVGAIDGELLDRKRWLLHHETY